MEENNMWKENFKSLNTSQQIEILQGTQDLISQRVQNEINAGIRQGNLDVIDISYNKLDGEKVVFDVTILDKTTGQETHEFFDDELDKIDLGRSQIEDLQYIGMDTSELENDLSQLDGLEKNQDSVSLSQLKEVDKQVDETAMSLGLSRDEILYSATIDSNLELKMRADSLGGSQYDRIDSDEKVSTYYNMGQVLGENYVSYQIIKTSGNQYRLMGIDEKGYAEEIGQDRVEYLKDVPAVSLMQENGEVRESRVLCAFRLKDTQSDINRDQVIGLCDSGSSDKTTFYARGAITTEQMPAISIPNRTYSEERVRQEQVMDTHYTPSVENMDLIAKVAERYDMDKNDLLDAVTEEYNGKDFNELTEDDIIKVAEYESRVPDRSERPLPGEPPKH